MRKLTDEDLAVRVHPDDVIVLRGRYYIGAPGDTFAGYVDFDERSLRTCPCGGCCVAGNLPFESGWVPDLAKKWLERIQSSYGEPELYRVAR